ncbi:MAG: response regulator [Candidatus Velthaea sp.]|jgi:two-component system phosphate regulon response regulator PhoB
MKRTIERCADSTDCNETTAVSRTTSDAAVRPRATIVIAEDDPATRMLLCRILTRASFIVHAFENGALACAAARAQRPDVIVLDWMMPVMDGCQAVEVLKSDSATRAIPIVMLSTHALDEDRLFAFETGVQDFITKPVDARELVTRIEHHLLRRSDICAAQTPPSQPNRPQPFERRARNGHTRIMPA